MKLLFIILLFAFTGGTLLSQPLTTVEKDGYAIPVYNFKGLEPLLQTSSDSVYVINFWATWCVPCVEELPNFLKADSVYKNTKMKMILVSLDMKSKIETQLIPFLKKRNIKTKVLVLSDMDMNAWIPKVSTKWEGSIPATVIFSKDKRNFFEQQFTYTELQTQLKKFNISKN